MEISSKKWYPPHLVTSLGLLMVTLMVKRRQLGIRVSIELRNVYVKIKDVDAVVQAEYNT